MDLEKKEKKERGKKESVFSIYFVLCCMIFYLFLRGVFSYGIFIHLLDSGNEAALWMENLMIVFGNDFFKGNIIKVAAFEKYLYFINFFMRSYSQQVVWKKKGYSNFNVIYHTFTTKIDVPIPIRWTIIFQLCCQHWMQIANFYKFWIIHL